MGGAAAGGLGASVCGLGVDSGLGANAGAWPADSSVDVARWVQTTGFALPVAAKAANATTPATAAASAAGANRKGAAGAFDAD